MITELELVLLKKEPDKTLAEVREYIAEARTHILEYEDVDDFMADWFGLESDYIYDIV